MGFVIGQHRKQPAALTSVAARGVNRPCWNGGWRGDSLRQMSPSYPPGLEGWGGVKGLAHTPCASEGFCVWRSARWKRDVGRWSRWPIRSNSWSRGEAHTRSSSPPCISAASFNHKRVDESNDSSSLSPCRQLSAGGWELSPDGGRVPRRKDVLGVWIRTHWRALFDPPHPNGRDGEI